MFDALPDDAKERVREAQAKRAAERRRYRACLTAVVLIGVLIVAFFAKWPVTTEQQAHIMGLIFVAAGRHRPVPLGHKNVRGRPLFALQTSQRAYLVALRRVDTRRAVLRPAVVSSTCDHCRSHNSDARKPWR